MSKAYIEKTYLFYECQYEEKIVDSEDSYDEYGNRPDEYVNQEYREPETIKCFYELGHTMTVNSGTTNTTFGDSYYLVSDDRVKQGDRIDGMIVKKPYPIPLDFGSNEMIYKVTFEG